MREYTIPHTNSTPDWSTIPCLHVDNCHWLPDPGIRMTAQLCWEETGLHIHLQSQEQNIRAEYDEPLSMVCEDSCMEFFFCPQEGDLRYFNFEINPNGRTYIGYGNSMDDLVRLVPQDEDVLLQKRTARTADGWEVFFTVPVSLIQVFYPGYALQAGKTLRANCYKCGDLTVEPHFFAWNPIDWPTPSFHRSCDFGRMILG